MRKLSKAKKVIFFIVAGGLAGLWPAASFASDHNESPLVKTDASMDITDLYVFDSGGGETTVIVCWAGLNDSRPQPDADGVYNPNALYAVNIDTNGDNSADRQIYWRYGQDPDGNYGVLVENLPGSDGPISGAVERVIRGSGGTRIWSGHADDPFFFDVQGYLDTLATGTLMIRNDRATVHGLNVTAIAFEMDTAALRAGSTGPIQFWVTSARK